MFTRYSDETRAMDGEEGWHSSTGNNLHSGRAIYSQTQGGNAEWCPFSYLVAALESNFRTWSFFLLACQPRGRGPHVADQLANIIYTLWVTSSKPHTLPLHCSLSCHLEPSPSKLSSSSSMNSKIIWTLSKPFRLCLGHFFQHLDYISSESYVWMIFIHLSTINAISGASSFNTPRTFFLIFENWN